jgi:hypothetical protein
MHPCWKQRCPCHSAWIQEAADVGCVRAAAAGAELALAVTAPVQMSEGLPLIGGATVAALCDWQGRAQQLQADQFQVQTVSTISRSGDYGAHFDIFGAGQTGKHAVAAHNKLPRRC